VTIISKKNIALNSKLVQLSDILQLSDIQPKDIIEENNCYHIKAIITSEFKFCNKCFSNNLSKNGTRVIMYRDIPIHNNPVGIHISFQRYQCKKCHNTIYQDSLSLDTKHLMTKRLVEYIYTKVYQRKFTELALEIGVNEKTIRNVFANNVDIQLKLLDIITPEVLGINEIHLVGNSRCVITNVEQATVIDILKTRNKAILMSYFGHIKKVENIKIVTMGMWQPHFNVISAIIPDAKIVIDKLHVVKMALEAMEKVQKNICKGLTYKERKQLKDNRYLLLTRHYQLTPMDKLTIEDLRMQYPLLGQAYLLKEGFYNIWNHPTKKEAERAYIDWCKQIPIELADYFIPIVNTVENWYKPIFNYFTNSYNNATGEALNELIKIMNRKGRCYSFEVLRSKILLIHGAHKIQALPGFNKNHGTSIQILLNLFELESTPCQL